jgi:hypothetical protein
MNLFYRVDLRASPEFARAFSITEQICEALSEVLPVTDIEPLLSDDERELRTHTSGVPNVRLAAQEELLRDTWDSSRRSYGSPRATAWPGLMQRESTSPENPFRRELWRGETRVALQYRGTLLSRMNAPALRALSAVWRECFGEGFDRIRGLNLCPAGGFIPWHTNERQTPGWRAYVIICDRDGESEFRYWTGERVECVRDQSGTLNLFSVSDEAPLFWHAVVSQTRRVSCGFRLTDDAVARLLDRSDLSVRLLERGHA